MKKKYEDLGLDINPLVIVQLPNDDLNNDEESVKKSIEGILGELKVPKEENCYMARQRKEES